MVIKAHKKSYDRHHNKVCCSVGTPCVQQIPGICRPKLHFPIVLLFDKTHCGGCKKEALSFFVATGLLSHSINVNLRVSLNIFQHCFL